MGRIVCNLMNWINKKESQVEKSMVAIVTKTGY